MTLRKIARWGHPVLLAPAREVEDPAAPAVAALARDMIETLADAGGVGLAAPQVFEGLRLIVALDVKRDEPREAARPLVIVNPALTPLGPETVEGTEGCLSIPGLRGIVPRFERVGWRGLDLLGRGIGGEAEGYFARILQHEVDHLDGILYPMRLRDPRYMGYEPEMDRLVDAMTGKGR